MADDTLLNPGIGGDRVRSLDDGTGRKYPGEAVFYTVTLAAGANVLQAVMPSAGLPVAQQGSWAVASNQDVGSLFNGTTRLTPLFATFAASAFGPSPAIAATAAKSILVLRWAISCNGINQVNLQSHTTTALATRIEYMNQYKTGGGAWCPVGHMATAAGEGLDVNLSGSVAVSGDITYVLI